MNPAVVTSQYRAQCDHWPGASVLPLYDDVCQLGEVPAVPRPDDAPELDILAQLYLTARLDPGCEELSAGQLAEQADLRLELVTTSAEYCWRLLFHPETQRF